MFERFTDKARFVVTKAQEEARALNHNYIGTEHVVLGILDAPESVAGRVLTGLGVTLEDMRDRVLRHVGRGSAEPGSHIPFTKRSKKTLELSLREAVRLGHNYIGTEHLLLGLVRAEGGNVGVQLLREAGVDVDLIRPRTMEILEQMNVKVAEAVGEDRAMRWFGRRSEHPGAVTGARCSNCRADLVSSARYQTVDVQEHEGDGVAEALFLFCSACGHLLDDVILPGT